ncbi:MAG: S8 family serine peptidase [Telluria sp.]
MTLYWVDRAGQLQTFATLKPGDHWAQSSFSSHVWELKSDDGKVGFKFIPTLAGDIAVGSDYQPSFTDYSEKVSQAAAGLWSTAQGYGLVNAAKSLGVPQVAALPLNGQNNNLALDAIDAPSAWAAGFTGKGVKVAVIDGGIADNSEVSGRIVGGYDFVDRDATPSPDAGPYRDHALGVASIIAASHDPHAGRDTMGVAPEASLLNVRVGNSTTGSNDDLMSAGIRYAVDQGAKVICMPLQSTAPQMGQSVIDAVHYAFQHNVVTVIIGGNYSNYGPTGPALIAQQLKGEVIDVGNYNVPAGAPFDSSNMPGANPFPWVMASSSGYVPNSQGGYTYWSDGGTSFAGPYVAGLAALLWQQNPNATASDIINKIIAGASIGGNAATGTLVTSLTGGASADVFNAAAGVSIDGAAGIDTVKYSGAHTGYTVAATATGFSVTNNADHTVNQLANVERLAFSDTAIALDVGNGDGGMAYRLYQAAFDRTPDAGGLGFWINSLDNGMALLAVADGFVKSGEFVQLYGATPSTSQLVAAMYQNVLHRAADAGGASFWVDAIDKHGVSVAQMLMNFSESPENQAAVAKVIGQGFAFTPYHG